MTVSGFLFIELYGKKTVMHILGGVLVCKMFNGRNTTEKLKFNLLLFNLVTNDKYFA